MSSGDLSSNLPVDPLLQYVSRCIDDARGTDGVSRISAGKLQVLLDMIERLTRELETRDAERQKRWATTVAQRDETIDRLRAALERINKECASAGLIARMALGAAVEPTPAPTEAWTCPKCGQRNSAGHRTCGRCEDL
jgi:rubrerythrin